MSARSDRLRASLRERVERDERLPRALCARCGGWAQAGIGTRDPEPEFTTPGERAEREHWLKSQPENVDGWRRLCAHCARAQASGRARRDVVLGAIGEDVQTEDDADVILHALITATPTGFGSAVFNGGVTAQAHGHGTGTPWGHLTEDERDKMRAASDDLAASRTARASSDGGCGMCGASQAFGNWWHGPDSLRWPNGAPVAFCSVCTAVWDLRGEPSTPDALRRVGVEAATGWAVPVGVEAPAEFRIYCETRGATPAGCGEAWDYGDGIRQYRAEVWTARPELAPPSLRDRYYERYEQAAQHRAAIRAAERAEADALAW